MIPCRIDKYLADATALSRRQIKDAWQAGRISVDRAAAPWAEDDQLWHLVFADDTVRLDNQPLSVSPPRHYFALHKPAGILSTTNSPQDRPCLQRWLKDLPQSIFPVGRLDLPTTGLLLLTDDGDLCYCLLRPQFHVEKEYHLTVRGAVADDDPRLQALIDGIDIGDRKPPAAALRTAVLESSPTSSRLSVVVDEGRHRMVRRMARRADFYLEHLHRPRLGPVHLGDVPAGELRSLSAAEVDALWQASGGKKASERRQIAALKRQAIKWRDQDRPHLRLEHWLAAHGTGLFKSPSINDHQSGS